ncbi:MAG TPA: VWA domain-containing protein [Alloacidobacterium sp.]|nr:VWA domain-containing protein [Alloacidobacterium sp.]
MRLCNKRPVFLFVLLASSLAVGAQTAAPQTQTPSRPEQQPSLTVDRDPIVSPDAADNQPVSPSNPGTPRPGESLEHNKKGEFTFRRDVDEVVLNATVLDDHGHLVNDLKQDDFHVFEDGVQQTIASFQHQDIPVSMGIIIDNSGSMRDKRLAVNSAALDLVKASNPQDEAFIVNFSDEAFIDQDFTSDINKLRDGLAHIDSKGGTALYDAVVASADQLAKNAKRPKQVLLIVTDGEDNASSLDLEQTIRRVQDLQGPVVYSIGLLFGDNGGGREARRAKRALQMLSNETGGIAYFPHSLNEVDEICSEVAHDIRNQYTIGYHSTKPASQGGYRIVKVVAAASGHGKLNVRTRSGYYPKSDKTGKGSEAQNSNSKK